MHKKTNSKTGKRLCFLTARYLISIYRTGIVAAKCGCVRVNSHIKMLKGAIIGSMFMHQAVFLRKQSYSL